MITVALAKGRLAQESAELLEKCGVDASVVFSDTRKLVLESADGRFSFFLVKPSDVPTYVEYGIADSARTPSSNTKRICTRCSI